jgi:quercetin dioxygenase-like cupin family protein
MNESSCEITAKPQIVIGSRVLKLDETTFRWVGVPVSDYKESAVHHCGVTRMALVGGLGEQTGFHLRYFEISPGGFSSREHHQHEHAVVILRGVGEVLLGEERHAVKFGDTVYVAPGEVHQFRNTSTDEPLGFLCVVDAERDRPVIVGN